MYIGIDLGTSSVKVLIMDEKGKVKNTKSKEYPLLFPKEGWIEQDPDIWIKKTFEIFEEFSKDELSKIKAISFSGQMHGTVFLDENNNVIRPALLWCDQRTEEECKIINQSFPDTLTSMTGNIAMTGFSAPKILWLKNKEPKNFKKIKKILLPKDYLAYKLSGVFSTDLSDASGTLLLDVKKRKWCIPMLNFLGITEKQLPSLYESYECVGTIDQKLVEEFGFNKDVKIVAGGGDQAVGAIGVGAVKPGILSVSLGTSGVVFTSNKNYSYDKKGRIHSFCHANGEYHQMGVMLSAAGALKWWIEDINKESDYSKLIEEANNSKFDKNLFFLPYLVGERTPHNNPNIRGQFCGLSIQHTRGDLTRCILEGISFGLYDSLKLMIELGIQPTTIRITGGGGKSKFWRQMISDIFQLKVERVNSIEGPAYGAAILAAIGDGCFNNVNEACEKLIKVIEITNPEINNKNFYENKYIRFRKLYPILCEIQNVIL